MALKDVKVKIAGVGKTKQITKAMYMVSSAKLRGSQQRIERFRPYADKFREVLEELAGNAGGNVHPLLADRPEPKTACIVLITSDRGLCGGFNANLIKVALKLAREKQAQGRAVRFLCVGRKGRDAVGKAGFEVIPGGSGGLADFDFSLAARIGESVVKDFLEETTDEVLLVYAEFISMGRQVPITASLLPMKSFSTEKPGGADQKSAQAHKAESTKGSVDYIYEPEVEELLAEILPRYIKVQVYRGLLDTAASEHAARMSAMDNATRNCDEITRTLTLLYNKARQSAITTELIDIVAGADALQ
ncbi:MAG: F0F1 ATP synthase subunit gamma [Deltaproteobacteria bacterium]|jgi:F-type H+-transporting ATPase subunit gamma|nr:F0F1 ATP synthase subunit gamma [Deltaproteobacteria bacterium]